MTKPNLSELNAVVTLAGRKNFRAAAGELGVSASALSHQVAGLEARLGVRLFNRTTRSVALTAAGEAFLARVRPALGEIVDAMEAVNAHRDTPSGVLRLNSSVGAAQQMMPVFLEYMRRYPEMQLDIVTEGRLIDIVAGGFDAGLRAAPLVPQDMVAVPYGPEQRFVVVATPDYFARAGRPKVPHDLLQHECIRWRLAGGALNRWEFERRGERFDLDVPGRLLLDSSDLMLEAALSGLGIAHLSEWLVRDEIAAGRLEAVLGEWNISFGRICVYYPGHRLVPAGLKALVGLVREMNGRG